MADPSRHARAALAAALALAGSAAATDAPPPQTSANVVAAALQEGKVVVYAATDVDVVAPLLADFAALYPRIHVEYLDLNTAEIQERFLDEVSSGRPIADVLWSPAMDLQMKLANDGFAAAYDSPEGAKLAPWAAWRNEAFGTTLEPFVFIHDRRRLPPAEVPQTHADLARWIDAQPERLRGRIGTYDPERSAIGYLLLTQDSRIDPGFPETLRAYARAGLALHGTTARMIERVRDGEELLAFNVNGSYALVAARRHPDLAVVYPKDYVLAASRIALIAKTAPHPNAARVFLDYILSRRGQDVMARRCAMFSIRSDVEGENTAAALARDLGARLKPIHVGPSLLVFLDGSKRADFIRRWRNAPAR
ncbi:MAG TPA: ABC transporter substrate-binding protein [Anaeromyxobacter sp.]|nr:ABC transporter substrate-binding protein [Anaeromyxobacter sp.]